MSEVEEQTCPLRILHFSDIHVGLHVRHMGWKQWFSKRAIGAINLLRGRAKYFDEAEEKMEALIRFKEAHNIDLVINTGDYSALGLESELSLAKQIISPLMKVPLGYLTVPGNHDLYVSKTLSNILFSKYFSEVLHSDMPERCSDGSWPLVRFIGKNSAVIALNSSRPNPWPWRSNGHISQEQLGAFEQILKDDAMKDRFIFVITHYALKLANGNDDTKLHGLINAKAFTEICSTIQKGAILCGHIHETYRVSIDGLNSELFCAGSATMKEEEGFWVYELKDDTLKAYKASWYNGDYHISYK